MGQISRVDLVAALVDDIDLGPYQQTYRRRPLPSSGPIIGWAPRLKAYFWPRPEYDYAKSVSLLAPIVEVAGVIARALRPWDDATQIRALAFAHGVFAWGGVPQRNVTAEQVDCVIQTALGQGDDLRAPMNSGWTKVAAIATSHLEAEGRSQAIWDSRVAWCVVRRLDAILTSWGQQQVPACLPHIGRVPGRGGTRWSTQLRLKWPNAYMRWDAHFEASDLIREVRDELNRRGLVAPLPDGSEGPWTVRQVEMVLFMDGY